jgi:tRNA (Thr-GGU) A37 N-methylase
VALRPIGHVRTAYKDMADTPIQTSRNPHEPGRVVVLDDYAAGLDGLDGFDLLDGTPVLDIKPFEPHLDVPGYQAGSGWLDQVRGGWYQRIDAAANPLVRPGRQGLRAAGLLDPGSVSDTAGERG